MMKFMSNYEVDKLKLHSAEVNKYKSRREKKTTCIQKSKLIDTPFAKYVLSKNLYILILCCHDEVTSTSCQIFEQTEIIQEIVLPGIYKLND